MISPEGNNLAFILSLPRSGSTILSLVLDAHSKLLCPPEPWFLLKLHQLTKPFSADHIYDDQLATIGTNEFLDSMSFTDAARDFALSAYNSKLTASKNLIFIDKTPRYYHILEFIDELFPAAKKIWLKRNPLDIVSSYKVNWKVGINGITEHTAPWYSADFFVGLFRLEEYFRDSSPNMLQVLYEDFAQKPEKVVSTICQFLGVEIEKDMLAFSGNEAVVAKHRDALMGDKKALGTSEISSESIDTWKDRLDDDEVRVFLSKIGTDIFKRMGYGHSISQAVEMGLIESPKIARHPDEECLKKLTLKIADGIEQRQFELMRSNNLLNKQLKDQKNNLERLKDQNSTLREKVNELADLRRQDNQDKVHLNRRLIQQRTNLERLKQENSALRTENAELSEIRGQNKEMIIRLQERASALVRKVDKLKADHRKKDEVIESERQRANDVLAELTRVRERPLFRLLAKIGLLG